MWNSEKFSQNLGLHLESSCVPEPRDLIWEGDLLLSSIRVTVLLPWEITRGVVGVLVISTSRV